MMWSKEEVFATATKEEIQKTKFLLSKYASMVSLMEDYEKYQAELAQVGIDGEVARRIEQDEYYSNKTVNALILMEKQKWVYEEYAVYTRMLRRAYELILDEEVKQVIGYRYMQGLSRNATIMYLRKHGWSDRTVDRRIESGIEMIANSLKVLGFFDRESSF